MSKPSSTDLFDLIKALTPSEKRYFKLSLLQTQQQTTYTQLFDIINAQAEADEAHLRKSLGLSAKKLSDLKSYLYQALINKLIDYYGDKHPDNRVHKLFIQAQLLQQKSLPEQTTKTLQKIKKLCEVQEKQVDLFRVNNWEKRILYGSRSFLEDETQAGIYKLYKEGNYTIKQIKNLHDYWFIYARLSAMYMRKGRVRDKATFIALTKLAYHPLLSSEKRALSRKAKNIYYATLCAYYYATGHVGMEYKCRYQHLKHIEKHIDIYKQGSNTHIGVLHNYILMLLEVNKFKVAAKYLRQMKQLPANDRESKLRIFTRTADLTLLYYTRQGKFEEGVRKTKWITQGIQTHKDAIDRNFLSSIYMSFSMLNIGNEAYKQAMDYISLITTNKALQKKGDIDCMARLIELMIHYETGNHLLLPYLIRSTQRYLKKRDRLYEAEKRFIQLIGTLLEIKGNKDFTKHLKSIKADFEKLEANPYHQHFFQIFDVVSWLEHKITGATLGQIIQNKIRAAKPKV